MNPREILRKLYQEFATSLNSVEVESLPEPFKAEMSALRTQLNTAIEKLPTIEAANAANAAANGLAALEFGIQRVTEIATGVSALLKRISGEAVSVNARIAEMDQKIKTGELLTKEQAQKLADDQTKSVQDKFALINTRRAELSANSIPEPPIAIAEATLSAKDDDFKARKAEAKARQEKLAAKQHSFNATQVAQLCWGDEAQFGLVLAAAPAKAGTPNPLLGGASGEKEKDEDQVPNADAMPKMLPV